MPEAYSKKDTLGREKVLLVGRSVTASPVLSQGVADSVRLPTLSTWLLPADRANDPQLRAHLPALPRLAQSWSLMYSTDQHGISMSTMYKKVEQVYGVGGGCLLAIREVGAGDDYVAMADGGVWGKPCFGVWLGTGMKCQDGAYYGSGERYALLIVHWCRCSRVCTPASCGRRPAQQRTHLGRTE